MKFQQSIFFLISMGISSISLAQQTFYVDGINGSSTNDGLTWQTAKQSIVQAVSEAASTAPENDTIMIKEGIYHEEVNNILTEPVHLYGGFSGNETTTSQSNPALYETILDGDVNGDDDPSNPNTYVDNLVYLLEVRLSSGRVSVNGITFANAYNNDPNLFGGNGAALVVRGILPGNLSAPLETICEVTDCIFRDNAAQESGAAFFAFGSTSLNITQVIADRCQFYNNRSLLDGRASVGIAYAFDGSTKLAYTRVTNSIIRDNQKAPNFQGEHATFGVYNSNAGGIAQGDFYNNTFYNNDGSAVIVINGNTSPPSSATLNARNNIVSTASGVSAFEFGLGVNPNGVYGLELMNNLTTQSLITNTTNTLGMIGSNIQSSALGFVDVATNNFSLLATSPAIDAGDNSANFGTDSLDFYGNDRIVNSTIDIGAIEFNPSTVSIDDLNDSKSHFLIFPNPTTGILNLSTNKDPLVIRIYGNGALIQSIVGETHQIDLSNLSEGIYFVEIETEVETIQYPVVKY